jgi:RNA polymerase sigma factor (sigma-70 family)
MTEINNPEAYFSKMVRNSDKNEYRSNDNFYNHISSVGDANDLQQECAKRQNPSEHEANSIEQHLSEASVENWLLLLDNTSLHKALSELPAGHLMLMYMLYVQRLKQAECALILGIKQAEVSRLHSRIKRVLQKRLNM